MSNDLLDNVLRVAADTWGSRSDAYQLSSIVHRFGSLLADKARYLFKSMGQVTADAALKKGIEQKATDINKIYADTVMEYYLNAKNSGLYDEWCKIYDRMVHDVLDEWMPKYGNKLNIIKRLLEKKYTFKWAFCVGTAQYNDKINKDLQDILRNV